MTSGRAGPLTGLRRLACLDNSKPPHPEYCVESCQLCTVTPRRQAASVVGIPLSRCHRPCQRTAVDLHESMRPRLESLVTDVASRETKLRPLDRNQERAKDMLPLRQDMGEVTITTGGAL
jgi:hypothetical protein